MSYLKQCHIEASHSVPQPQEIGDKTIPTSRVFRSQSQISLVRRCSVGLNSTPKVPGIPTRTMRLKICNPKLLCMRSHITCERAMGRSCSATNKEWHIAGHNSRHTKRTSHAPPLRCTRIHVNESCHMPPPLRCTCGCTSEAGDMTHSYTNHGCTSEEGDMTHSYMNVLPVRCPRRQGT